MLVGVTIVCHLTVCIPAYFSSYTILLFCFGSFPVATHIQGSWWSVYTQLHL
jgi:hypothetical protein